jgi:hypothetical protein
MAINFDSFSDKSSFSLTDKIVGFDSATPNGEKKWTYSTLLKSVSGDITIVKIQDTAPTSPKRGDLWLDSTSGVTYVYYVDANSSQWIDIGGGDSATELNVVDSPTINLNYNTTTKVLSADVIENYVTTASLSASPAAAKAWVNFDGTLVTNPGSTTGIRSSYNISSITDVGIGEYQVNMSVSQLNSNFAVFCESGITAGVGALNPTRPDVWLAPMTSWGNSYVTVNINNSQGPNDDSSLVTVVIFSN